MKEMVDQVDNLKKKKKKNKNKNKQKEDGEKVKRVTGNYFIVFIYIQFLPTLQRMFIKRGGKKPFSIPFTIPISYLLFTTKIFLRNCPEGWQKSGKTLFLNKIYLYKKD